MQYSNGHGIEIINVKNPLMFFLFFISFFFPSPAAETLDTCRIFTPFAHPSCFIVFLLGVQSKLITLGVKETVFR